MANPNVNVTGSTESNWKALAAAVVAQACSDLDKGRGNCARDYSRDAENFFRGAWGEYLCSEVGMDAKSTLSSCRENQARYGEAVPFDALGNRKSQYRVSFKEKYQMTRARFKKMVEQADTLYKSGKSKDEVRGLLQRDHRMGEDVFWAVNATLGTLSHA